MGAGGCGWGYRLDAVGEIDGADGGAREERREDEVVGGGHHRDVVLLAVDLLQ